MKVKKIFSLAILFVIILSLVGCSGSEPKYNDEYIDKIKELEKANLKLISENNSLKEILLEYDIDIKDSGIGIDSQETSKNVPETLMAEATVTDKVIVAWESYSNIEAHAAAEITNTGGTQILINKVTFDIEDEYGKLIGSEYSIFTYPKALDPGMSAYVSISKRLSDIDLEKEIDVEVYVDYEETYFDVNSEDSFIYFLEVEDISGNNRSSYTNVIGRVVNNTGFDIEGFNVAVAMFDDNNSLLGVFRSDSRDLLKSGSKIGFETIHPSIEIEDYYKKVATYKGVATNRTR